MFKSVILGDSTERVDYVWAQGRRENLATLTDLYPDVVSSETLLEHVDKLKDVEVAFGTWGFPQLTEEQIDLLPNLKAVFYAAGSVQAFARPFLNKGVKVFSAWAANAVPVAEYTVAQILLASKGYFQNIQDLHKPDDWRTAYKGPGVYGESIAIVGVGMIGQLVIDLLKPFVLDVCVVSSHMTKEEADAMGVRRVSLEEAFKTCYVVSNHMANRPHTVGSIKGEHFKMMRPNAVFINTGRGAQIVEEEMVGVLKERQDIIALLDVTFPEPPLEGSPLYTLPNVFLTSHIAGSLNDEVIRMADYALSSFANWAKGEGDPYEVTLDMLATMA